MALLCAELKQINGTILPDDYPVIAVGGIHAALAESNDRGLSDASLWRLAKRVEVGSYVWLIDGYRMTMPSSARNDVNSLMPA